MAVVDSHHHLWNYDPQDYGWITDEMQVLKRNYTAEDLQAEITKAGVQYTIAVQARQKLEETKWLLEVAQQNPFIKGVVGWVPLIDPDVGKILDELKHPLLKGVRHVLQDEPDENYMLRDDFNRGIKELKTRGLVYDILIYSRHLPQTIKFVDMHPEQPFVLDHIAKPVIRRERFDSGWEKNIRELAKRDNVTCKFSGVVTEVRDPEWSLELIRSYWEVVLEAFGPNRLMFGSDWPVCRLRAEYCEWFDCVKTLTAELSEHERNAVLGQTAASAYHLVVENG